MIARKYGLTGFRTYRPEPLYKIASPTKVDHVDRKTLAIPIRDQLDEGACTGFGTTRAIQGALGLPVALSPQFNYFNGRVREATQDTDAGAMIGDVLDAFLEYGAAKESVYPYVPKQFAQRPTLDAYADATALKGKVKVRRVFGSAQFRNALATPNTIVVLGFSVPEYFESQQMADTGWLPVPGPRDRFIGGHCVACDGFDSRNVDATEPYLWCPNSWAADWGIAGWFKMPLRWVDDPRRLVDDCYAVQPV